MQAQELAIPGVYLFTSESYSDHRGFFSELFRLTDFHEIVGENTTFVQENFSFSKQKYTIRGLHAQSPPHAQGKLLRCTRGRIRDVAVDIRKASPSYGQSVIVDLSAENMNQLWVPPGFLHGFMTLENDCELLYKVTGYYAPECEFSVKWNDEKLGIEWGQFEKHVSLSKRDENALSFSTFESPF